MIGMDLAEGDPHRNAQSSVAVHALGVVRQSRVNSQHDHLRELAYRPMTWLIELSDAIAVRLAVLDDGNVLYLDKLAKPAGTQFSSARMTEPA